MLQFSSFHAPGPGPEPAGRHRRSQDERRPEWLEFPDGLRMASPIHEHDTPCPVCQAERGERHLVTCPRLPCPKCEGQYAACDCTDPLIAQGKYAHLSAGELLAAIDALAQEYQGYPTRLSRLQAHPVNLGALARKAQALEKAVALKKASDRILDRHPASVILKWRNSGTTPRYVEQGIIMSRVAHRLWLDWAFV